MSQAAAKYMVQNKVGNGSIINISSMAGKASVFDRCIGNTEISYLYLHVMNDAAA